MIHIDSKQASAPRSQDAVNPDQMIYFVQVDFGGRIGLSWVERDPARMDRKSTISDILGRQFGYIAQILECNPVEKICHNVTEDIMREVSGLFQIDIPSPADRIAFNRDRARDYAKETV